MLFVTDYEYIPYNFKKQQIQHFLIEANYQEQFIDKDLPNYEHKLQGHASLETCVGAIKANQTKAECYAQQEPSALAAVCAGSEYTWKSGRIDLIN
jgi:hypothetical protein